MNKKDLSERDICTKFITPAITGAGWDINVQVREQVYITKGRVIVRGGRVLGVDEAAVRERAQAAAEALRTRNQPLWDLAERVAPVLGHVCRDLARTPFAVYRWAGREAAGTSHLP